MKGMGTRSGESGGRNAEPVIIRSRAESRRGHVKLKTVTEIRWSRACNTLLMEQVLRPLRNATVDSLHT